MKALLRGVVGGVLMSCLFAGNARAADPDPHEAERKQLLAVFAEVEGSINDQNIDRMLAQMDDNVTVIWLNAEVSRGKDEVKAYYRRMVGGENAILKKYLTKAKVGAPAKFYGDIAVADGSAADEFYPNARGVFRLDSRWSAALVRKSGEWKIVSLHLSSNVFNNPLLDEIKADIVKAAVVGFVVGLVLMYLIVWLMRRRARVTSP